MKAQKKRTLAITGHIGNWELIPQFIALNISNQVHVIARETTNTLLEDRIISPLRRRFGVKVLYKKCDVTHAACLKKRRLGRYPNRSKS